MTTTNNSIDAGKPTCDCNLIPCSLQELIVSCSHCDRGDVRYTLKPSFEEQAIDNKLAVVRPHCAFIVGDKNSDGIGPFDQIKVEAIPAPNAECPEPSKCLEIVVERLERSPDGSQEIMEVVATGHKKLKSKLRNSNSNSFFENRPKDIWEDLKLLSQLTWGLIFGDLNKFADFYAMSVDDHNGHRLIYEIFEVYPYLEWKSESMGLGGSVTIYSSLAIDVEFENTGKITGKVNQTEFELSLSSSRSLDHAINRNIKKLRNIIPGLDKPFEKLMKKFDGGESDDDSYVKLRFKQNLGTSSIKLIESNPCIGLEGKISFGMEPLLGITLHIDIVQVVTNAGGPVGKTVQKALDVIEEGYNGEVFGAKGHVSVYLEGTGDLNTTAEFVARSDGTFNASGAQISGRIGLEVGAIVHAEARVWLVTGTFDLYGKATAGLTLTCDLVRVPAPPDGVGWKLEVEDFELVAGISGGVSVGAERPINNSETTEAKESVEAKKVNEAKTIIPGFTWQNY